MATAHCLVRKPRKALEMLRMVYGFIPGALLFVHYYLNLAGDNVRCFRHAGRIKIALCPFI